MYSRHMISNDFRFHGHGSLRYVYRNGQVDRSRWFMVRYVQNTRRTKPRLSVIVSKKVFKSAVKRNRIRRRVYEVLRSFISDQSPVIDIVVTVYAPEVFSAESDEIREQLTGLMRRIKFIDDKSRKL